MPIGNVIIRAYADEPYSVCAVGGNADTVEVIGPSGGPEPPQGWPRRFVFDFDGTLFDRLREAYERGDADALRGLWNEAKPTTIGVETDHGPAN